MNNERKVEKVVETINTLYNYHLDFRQLNHLRINFLKEDTNDNGFITVETFKKLIKTILGKVNPIVIDILIKIARRDSDYLNIYDPS